LRWVPVSSRHLPASGCGFSIDHAAGIDRPGNCAGEPIPTSGDKIRVAGWAHTNCEPREVELFLAFESLEGTEDRIVRVSERLARPDVVAALPEVPAVCGFDAIAELDGLPAGTYRVAIVQRTREATYRDATAVILKRDGVPCSNA
jgi:hypothetical protein